MYDWTYVLSLALRISGSILLILLVFAFVDNMLQKLTQSKVRPSEEFKVHMKNTRDLHKGSYTMRSPLRTTHRHK